GTCPEPRSTPALRPGISTPAPEEAREVDHEETEDRSTRMGDLAMVSTISPETLTGLLEGRSPFALIDVREAGEYNSSHIPGASLIARRQLELSIKHAVPLTDTHVVLCDDDGRRAQLAAASVERLGYRRVSVLDGGINRWVTDG